MHILSVVGARPNFMKIAPIAWEAARRDGIQHTIVHTGQHYDDAMSARFFDVLSIPRPDVNLDVGSGAHGLQTGTIMIRIEPLLQQLRPDWVITVGDVNSTAAASLVAVKLGLRTAHVEAGLRSNDRTMPEEINRLVTDSISDALFVTEQSGLDHLKQEGVADDKVFFVGNVMIDTLIHLLPRVKEAKAWETYNLQPGNYLLVTLHRPSNVDDPARLEDLVLALRDLAKHQPVIFPVHPRTQASLHKFGLWNHLAETGGVILTDPMDYLTFLSLTTSAKALVTDSGGIQEETTYLGIPCLTLRPNTERPVTITMGTNVLVEPERRAIGETFDRLLRGEWKTGNVPPLWDGHAAERIISQLMEM